ncbi:unnamed protein product [Rotaria socialis]|uniref:Vesicle transport protein n=1 Tax=Rotaria socialis TaxID=392032 RepID=A0A820SWE8_9BILA|nr:unnamed protein product [Rotaria socialis]
MNKVTRFFNPDEEQPKEQNAIMSEISGLSWDTRLKGFGICLLIALMLGIGAVVIYFLGGNLSGFAILYSCAVIFGLISTLFLMGPLNQLKKMFDSTRWIATVVFLASVVMTLVSALVIKIGVLVLIFVIVQFLALAWYTISYIPFARDAIKSCCGGIMGKRLRSITSLGLRNLTVHEFNFTVHFTLHRNEKTVAFYTSELAENQRSPEWSYLKFPSTTQCLQDFVMRVWITSEENSRLFLEYDVHLDDSLIPDEQKDDSQRSNNTLWLEMFGYQFTDNETMLENQKNVQLTDTTSTTIDKKSKRISLVKSYNKLSILRMMNVIDAVRSENRSSTQYLERLQAFVDVHQDHLSKIKERESRRLRVESLRQQLQSQIIVYEQRFNSYQERQKLLEERKNQLQHNLYQLIHQHEQINFYINHLNQSKCILHDLTQVINFRQKDIVHEIYHYIYPIIVDDSGEYSIANVKLPQAEDKTYQTSMTREREKEVEAAIGYCAHFVFIISQFMQIPLRFPIEFYGTSPIKIYDYSLQSGEFALYPSYDMNSFQYGLYLLNRDIGQLMYHCRVGTRPTDYRKTLKNLKDLLEQYFTITNNNNNNNQIHLYSQSSQSSTQTIVPTSLCINEQRLIRHKQNSSNNSLLSLSASTASSLIETLDLDQNGDDSDDIDLFPTLNSISPRLRMQFSQQ